MPRTPLILLTLLVSHAALAQSNRQGYDKALGVGFGINKINFDDRSSSTGVTYFTGNFRFNFWDDEPSSPQQRRNRLKGFLEAEVGYWSDEDVRPFKRDLLVGLNAIANISAGSADVFFGAGFGYHFFGDPITDEVTLEDDDGAIGANLQFGVELNFASNIAFFGLGRYDILAGDIYDFQTKILGGLRFKFD